MYFSFEPSAASAASALPDDLTADAVEALIRVVEAIPFAQPAAVLLRDVYRAAKGAKYCQQQCRLFAKYVHQVVEMFTKIQGTQFEDPSIATALEAILTEVKDAITFMQTLEGRGFVRRMLSSKSDDTKLQRLSASLHDKVQLLTAQLTVEMAITPPSSAEFRQDAEANEQLRSRVEAMGGLDQLDPADEATMRELTQDLPFAQQFLREELMFHVEELQKKTDAIMKEMTEGPWDVIENKEVRWFWYKRIKQNPQNVQIVIEMLMHLFTNPTPLGPQAGPLVLPMSDADIQTLANTIDKNKDGNLSVLEADAAFPADGKEVGARIIELISNNKNGSTGEQQKLVVRPRSLPIRNRHFTGRG